MVVNEAEFRGVWFGDHPQRHAVHAWKKVAPEGGRIPPQTLLFIALLPKENAVRFISDGTIRFIVSDRVVVGERLDPRPKPLSQTEED
jgi:hypothetical protein